LTNGKARGPRAIRTDRSHGRPDAGDDAYGVSIFKKAQELVGSRSISLGAVYVTLDRMEDKGYLTSWLSDPTPERGGRAKRPLQAAAARRNRSAGIRRHRPPDLGCDRRRARSRLAGRAQLRTELTMPYHPSRRLESVFAALLPPACREHVLGDLSECAETRGQYIGVFLAILPKVVVSAMRRKLRWGIGVGLMAGLSAVALAIAALVTRGPVLPEMEWLRWAAPWTVWVTGCALAAAYGPAGTRLWSGWGVLISLVAAGRDRGAVRRARARRRDGHHRGHRRAHGLDAAETWRRHHACVAGRRAAVDARDRPRARAALPAHDLVAQRA
jgi:hypothetical protein